ncbi:hypothetical protein ASZ90_019237 [hydrocarbon metagenome]|uniref:Uncharacterized protein n=1 Tax=hydrocarbon metagenome TaxID=938273 RepID=A0A0W8E3U9_9ZZZZ
MTQRFAIFDGLTTGYQLAKEVVRASKKGEGQGNARSCD